MLRRQADAGDSVTRRPWTRTETRRWTVLLFSGTCMLYAARIALPICAAAIAKEYNWNKTDSGTVLSCFFWGYAFTQVFAGGIADSYGGEKILPLTSVGWSVLTLFTPQVFDLAYWTGAPLCVLLLLRVATGFTQAFHVPSTASMVSRGLIASEKGRVFGVIMAGSHAGTVLAGVIGSLLLEYLGWRAMFHVCGLLSLCWCYWLNVVTSPREKNRKEPDSDEESLESKGLDVSTQVMGPAPSVKVPWATLFKHPSFWAAAVAQYTGANAYMTIFHWLPSYFHETFPTAKGVVYNVVPSLAIVTTSLLAPIAAQRMLSQGTSMTATRKIMEGISLVGVALCLLMVPLTSSFSGALFWFTIAMGLRGLHHAGVEVNPHDFAPNHTGSVFGIFNACGAITGFIGVYIAGHILEVTGNNWTYVFEITSFQCIIGAVVYALMGTGSKII